MKPLKISILDDEIVVDVLLYLNQIVFIERNAHGWAVLNLSNGKTLICVSPCYQEWEADTFLD